MTWSSSERFRHHLRKILREFAHSPEDIEKFVRWYGEHRHLYATPWKISTTSTMSRDGLLCSEGQKPMPCMRWRRRAETAIESMTRIPGELYIINADDTESIKISSRRTREERLLPLSRDGAKTRFLSSTTRRISL